MKSISLCVKYSLYNPEGKWRAVVQAVGRALSGKCEKEWLKLEADTTNWTANGKNKHKVLVQKLCQKVFKKSGYKSQKDVMREGLTYKGHDHAAAIEQLFELNDLLPLLAEGATEFDEEEFHRNIIPATLKPTIRVEFIKTGGKTSGTKKKS